MISRRRSSASASSRARRSRIVFPALAELIIHLPIAVIEGIVLGFTVGFLVRVKPELLGWHAEPEKTPCVADTMA